MAVSSVRITARGVHYYEVRTAFNNERLTRPNPVPDAENSTLIGRATRQAWSRRMGPTCVSLKMYVNQPDTA